jgi:hypothetical protein
VNYQPRLPQCKANRLGLPQIAILLEDEFETRTYASLFRCVEFAPIEKRLQIFHLWQLVSLPGRSPCVGSERLMGCSLSQKKAD